MYVAGNHEYYGKALPRLTEALQEESDEAARFLERDVVELAGVRIFGCTLWTDFQLHPNPSLSRMTAELRMNDYRKIRVSPQYRKLRVADTLQIHWRSREWLQAAASRGETRNAVIITHHAPSPRSLGDGLDDPLSPAYASDLEALIEATGAQLWIHGHTHRPVDYILGGTRVISNPRGYVDEPVKGFDPGLVVEVTERSNGVGA